MSRARFALLLLATLVGGLAARPAAAQDSVVAAPVTPPPSDPSRITAAEIAAARVATAYEAVDRLHHAWFRDRLSGQPVTVYTDANRNLGGADALRRIPAATVTELRYQDGRTAVTRWPEARGGVIIVVQAR